MWDCSLALAAFIASAGPPAIGGKRVLELGAGCGLVSVLCAALGAAEVVATDTEDLLPLLRLNLAHNCSRFRLWNAKVGRSWVPVTRRGEISPMEGVWTSGGRGRHRVPTPLGAVDCERDTGIGHGVQLWRSSRISASRQGWVGLRASWYQGGSRVL